MQNGQSRSLQLRESNDDKRTSRQIGIFLRSNLRSRFSLVWKLWRWRPSSLALWMLLTFLRWCFFVGTLKYSNLTRLVTCYVSKVFRSSDGGAGRVDGQDLSDRRDERRRRWGARGSMTWRGRRSACMPARRSSFRFCLLLSGPARWL